MACLGLYQRKMSRLRYEIIENFPFGKGSRTWNILELEVFPKRTCWNDKNRSTQNSDLFATYPESMSWVLRFHGTQIATICNSKFCCYLARLLVHVVHGKSIIKLSCFLCWFHWKLLIHGVEWDLNLALAQLSNYNLGTFDLEDQP